MIRIRIKFDAYDRVFKLVDREFGSVIDDGAVYELELPLMPASLDEDEDCNYHVELAHA